jgi:hypothetical protein
MRGPTQIFYWGANDRYTPPWDLGPLLQAHFGEHPERLSEPDVLLVIPSAIVIIEAKFGSPNPKEPDKPFERYVAGAPDWFTSAGEARAAGYYELVRNWAIGGALASRSGRAFALVNLVRDGQELHIERALTAALTPKGRFTRLTWEQVVQTVEPSLSLHLRDETLNGQPAFPMFAQPAP